MASTIGHASRWALTGAHFRPKEASGDDVMNSITASIVALNQKLLGAPFDYAFLGGSVLSLLVNDPSADAIRVTMDVDIIADMRTRKDFHKEERELEAFEERGRQDFIGSTDFEDVICLFNGRKTIVDEILSEPTICHGISEKFARYVKMPDFEDAVMGFVQTERDSSRRYIDIMAAFKRLAEHQKAL